MRRVIDRYTVEFSILDGGFLYHPANREDVRKRGQTDERKWLSDWHRGHAGEIGVYYILRELGWDLAYPDVTYGRNKHNPDLVGCNERKQEVKIQVKSLSDYSLSYVFQKSALSNPFPPNYLLAGISVKYLGCREAGLFKASLMNLMPMPKVPPLLKPLLKEELDSKLALYVKDIPSRFVYGSRLVGGDFGCISELQHPEVLQLVL